MAGLLCIVLYEPFSACCFSTIPPFLDPTPTLSTVCRQPRLRQVVLQPAPKHTDAPLIGLFGNWLAPIGLCQMKIFKDPEKPW